jgi:hypothetical protein
LMLLCDWSSDVFSSDLDIGQECLEWAGGLRFQTVGIGLFAHDSEDLPPMPIHQQRCGTTDANGTASDNNCFLHGFNFPLETLSWQGIDRRNPLHGSYLNALTTQIPA